MVSKDFYRGALGGAFVLLLLDLPHSTWASCRLPISFPTSAEPSGCTIGPQNSLVVVSDGGTVIFIDLDDYSVREDTALNNKYLDTYGWFDLEGVTMVSPERTFMYLGMENKAAVLEFEWHSSHRITRRFSLPGLEMQGNLGMESLSWVPTDASHHGGYFYVGSQLTGHVFIYEVPLLDDTGPEATAHQISVWTPLKGNNDVSGLAYSDGYVFVTFDDGSANHVLIYPILQNGLPGALKEQYEVDVPDAEGIAVRKTDSDTYEVFFSSDSKRAVFGYTFHFDIGFELHSTCRHAPASGTVVTRQSSRLTELIISFVTPLLLACGVSDLSRP